MPPVTPSTTQRERQYGQQDGEPGRCGQDTEGEVAGGLRYADDGGRGRSDRHRH